MTMYLEASNINTLITPGIEPKLYIVTGLQKAQLTYGTR